jgi:gluconokinase
MSEGIPLTDEDRWPWLDLIGAELRKGNENNGVVVSCSALKKIYRDRLREATGGPLAFVYLDGSLELLSRRMGERKGHFMPLSLLQTQLATLEVPTGEPGVVTVSIDATPEEITANALSGLKAMAF